MIAILRDIKKQINTVASFWVVDTLCRESVTVAKNTKNFWKLAFFKSLSIHLNKQIVNKADN